MVYYDHSGVGGVRGGALGLSHPIPSHCSALSLSLSLRLFSPISDITLLAEQARAIGQRAAAVPAVPVER